MTRPRNSPRCWVLLAGLTVLLAACSRQTDQPTSSNRPTTAGSPTNARPADPAAIAWVGRLCETVGGLVRAIQEAPSDTGPVTNPDDLKRDFSIQLGAASTGLAAATEQLGQLGSSPVTGGDQAARDLAAKYTKVIDPVNKAKTELDALPTGSSEQDIGRVMGTVWPSVAAVGARPSEGIPLGTDLTTAGNQSPTCQTQLWWRQVDR